LPGEPATQRFEPAHLGVVPTDIARVVLGASCNLRMDGRGAWRNVFLERLWRSLKYERVYLKACDSVSAARADIAEYLAWYSARRSHSTLDRATPDEACFAGMPELKMAAQNATLWCAPSCPPRRSFVASDARRRGQLCTFTPPAAHL
jgi:putative transposase